MASSDLFLDTSGFYALLSIADRAHHKATSELERARKEKCRLVTTDYVLSETVTLLKARGIAHLSWQLFDLLDQSQALRMEHIDPQRFAQTRQYFLKHMDQTYSFADCSSFVVMHELGLRDALTTDSHFHQAGFKALLRF